MNETMQAGPLGGMMGEMLQRTTGESELKPTMPKSSKVAIAIALLTAVGSVACFVLANSKGQADNEVNDLGNE